VSADQVKESHEPRVVRRTSAYVPYSLARMSRSNVDDDHSRPALRQRLVMSLQLGLKGQMLAEVGNHWAEINVL
jgi:hypothetical protein